jgi:hypothetical protein
MLEIFNNNGKSVNDLSRANAGADNINRGEVGVGVGCGDVADDVGDDEGDIDDEYNHGKHSGYCFKWIANLVDINPPIECAEMITFLNINSC